MKLPRGISGDRVVRALERLGYEAIRQKGSHVDFTMMDRRFTSSLS
jgi:predicted RNA binding protein YcfA (HicA-like mRNA interferase family)